LIALGHLRVRRGDPDALTALEEARKLAGPIDEVQRSAPLAVAMAEFAWLAGDLSAMRRELAPVLEAARSRSNQWMRGELSVWMWRAQALESPTARMAPPYVLEINGDWRGAASAWQALGCPYEHALVLGWYGGEADQRQALESFAELGAVPAAEALRRHMRAQGVRSVPRGARVTTQQHPQGLTKREAQILQLMKEGHRNAAIAKRLFLSTRTVDHHVSAILAKLGVSSRTEAVAQAGEPPEASG
jgi:DNA-binding CsgD family transcriptional regulator